MQTLLSRECFKHIINLELIEIKSDSFDKDITSAANLAEL